MIDQNKLNEKLAFMLENQIGLEQEHGDLPAWNKGYKEAIVDIMHFLEHSNDQLECGRVYATYEKSPLDEKLSGKLKDFIDGFKRCEHGEDD
jgi:hypothetical protein